MRLSWNEIRVRAAAFARDWDGEGYEKGQTQLFYKDFFEVFGVPVRRVALFEQSVKKLDNSSGYIDLFWTGVLLVEQKSIGLDLAKARTQALDYCSGLKDTELPRYVMLSDFQTFELYDLDEGIESKFSLADLPKKVEKLAFILGVQKRAFKDQDPVNIKASELVGKLHDALEESGYTGKDLEQFLVRIVFCLFADDTGIFEPRDIFLDFLANRTTVDGSDLGGWLTQLFQVLDTPDDERPNTLDEDLTRFPYVNGDLFHSDLRIPSFNSPMRQRLLDACQFDWSEISPAIFGALFQSVMDSTERRAQGAHYTTEKNIMKVIQPLFLDDLRSEFTILRKRRDSRRGSALEAFRKELGKLRFFDPACGCGNFLIIAYRELRALEIDVFREIRKYLADGEQLQLDAEHLSCVDVDQFYGIEIGEFPAKIAETAMWMMDHIMNNRISLEFGQMFTRIPLRTSPHITCADALQTDWNSLLSAKDCSYVFGNPPFVGSKYQSAAQRKQVRDIAGLGGTGGTLDYVTAWYIKAAQYIQDGPASIGFVATNSIIQGEQVAQLWPTLLGKNNLEIIFAHRTFAWGSDARGKAHVHVVIIGLAVSERAPAKRRLFSYEHVNSEPHESTHTVITPYLFDGGMLSNPHLVVKEVGRPLNGLPRLRIGSKPIDGGHYIFTEEEKKAFLADEPTAAPFMHSFVGSKEFLQGQKRYILWLGEADPTKLAGMPKVTERIRAVRKYREASNSSPTQKLASTPTLFHVNVIPNEPFLVVPKVSSERRDYIPIGWREPPTIPSDLVFVLMGATKKDFAIVSSAMHMSWVRNVGGRLESRYRYSIGLVYNPFPVPVTAQKQQNSLATLVDVVLEARATFPKSSLSDLYDPDLMPAKLRKAHDALDRAVDKLYRRAPFKSDRERVEHLFGLYEKITSPLVASIKKKRRRSRSKDS